MKNLLNRKPNEVMRFSTGKRIQSLGWLLLVGLLGVGLHSNTKPGFVVAVAVGVVLFALFVYQRISFYKHYAEESKR